MLDVMLRDRLVCGINDTQMQRQLFVEKNLTFESAYTLSLGMETAAKNTQTCSDLQSKVPVTDFAAPTIAYFGEIVWSSQQRDKSMCWRSYMKLILVLPA